MDIKVYGGIKMRRKDVVEIVIEHEQIREGAMEDGLSEEQYLANMKSGNEEAYGCKYDIEIVEDWRASPPGYQKKYKMRRVVKGRNYIVVALPYEIVKREACKRNMTVDQFIIEYEAAVRFNDSEYLTYRFKKIFKG